VSLADPARRSGRRQLLLVASLFVVPLAAAAWLYFWSGWRPAAGAHGKLTDPPRLLLTTGLVLPDGGPAPPDIFQSHWTLIHVATGACDERTRAILDELARIRFALGKDAPRVRRALLHAGQCAAAEFQTRDTDLLVLAATAARGSTFLSQFPPATDGAYGIYIVDPHGYLMMSYAASGPARGLLKDLERLLRLSNIG